MKKILFLLSFSFISIAKAQEQMPSIENIGFSLNLLDPIFGEYNLGLIAFLNPFVQVTTDFTYYSTQYITPEISGWQGKLRWNYFYSSYLKSGFYFGAAGGFESVDVKNDSSTPWQRYRDPTWSVDLGYAWAVREGLLMTLSFDYGYQLGATQILPEIGFLVLF